MSRLKPNIDDRKTMNKAELAIYKRLKKSFEQIKLHREGKIEMKTIEEVLVKIF